MSDVRSQPCSACPYRQDAPSGVWAKSEYDKLRDYDKPTGEQPIAPFACHATPDHHCHGWAAVHSNRAEAEGMHGFDLLALRFAGNPEIPEASVPLFASGNEAADHGERDIDAPSPEAIAAGQRLIRKYERLR